MNRSLTTFLDTAYSYQSGEFYPETHLDNLKKLEEEFSEYDKDLIDCLYKFAAHFDSTAMEFAELIYHRHMKSEEALRQLGVTFYHFS